LRRSNGKAQHHQRWFGLNAGGTRHVHRSKKADKFLKTLPNREASTEELSRALALNQLEADQAGLSKAKKLTPLSDPAKVRLRRVLGLCTRRRPHMQRARVPLAWVGAAKAWVRPAAARADGPAERATGQVAALNTDFDALREALVAEGFFKPDLLHVTFRVLEVALMWVLGTVLLLTDLLAAQAVGAVMLSLAQGRCGWLMHEGGHYSMTGKINVDRRLQEFIYGFGCGQSGAPPPPSLPPPLSLPHSRVRQRMSGRPCVYLGRPQRPVSSTIQRCKKLRIVTVGVSGRGSLTGPLRDSRRFPATRWYFVPGANAYAVGVWDLSIVQGPFSVAPRQTLRVTIRNFSISLYSRAETRVVLVTGGGAACDVPGAWWRNQHNKHHATPQKLQHDVDLNTLPLMAFSRDAPHVSTVKPGSLQALWLKYQAFLFFPVTSFLVGLGWTLFLHPKHSARTRRPLELASMAARYATFYLCFAPK
jgi:hypothetical protein